MLTQEEQAIARGERGEGAAMAMRIVAEAARLMGASRLIPMAIPALCLPKNSLRGRPASRCARP